MVRGGGRHFADLPRRAGFTAGRLEGWSPSSCEPFVVVVGSARNARTSDSRNLRCPPGVRRNRSRPAVAHLVTVCGCTRKMRATSAVVSSGSVLSSVISIPCPAGVTSCRFLNLRQTYDASTLLNHVSAGSLATGRPGLAGSLGLRVAASSTPVGWRGRASVCGIDRPHTGPAR